MSIALTHITGLFEPPDVDHAADTWGANCAPCALAAVIGKPLSEVRRGFPWFPERAWTSPSQLATACATLGFRPVLRMQDETEAGRHRDLLHVTAGPRVAIVQFTGPWTKPGANPRWAYRQTHAVGLHLDCAYDVNVGWWTTIEEWARFVAPEIASWYPRADGGWYVKAFVTIAPQSGGGR